MGFRPLLLKSLSLSSQLFSVYFIDIGPCLEIVNTVDYNVLEVNPQMKTRKKDNDIHGIGLKSVKDIVERYDGMLNFNQESNRFYVYVSLKR